jgi:hypothetical protein
VSESRLDRMLRETFVRQQREDAERARRMVELRDPFKTPRVEPSRARPRKGGKRATSLGGEHS